MAAADGPPQGEARDPLLAPATVSTAGSAGRSDGRASLLRSPGRRPSERSVSRLPHDRPGESPTHGFASGRHRVLEPPGALPLDATRLDPHPDVWDVELRLELRGVVFSVADLGRLASTFGVDPATRRAALLEACAERGGLPPQTEDAQLIGLVVAVGSGVTQPVGVGDTVVTTAPATAVPAWLSDLSGWDGVSRVAPAAGHAVIGDGQPLVKVDPGQAAEVSAVLAANAGVEALVADAVHPGDRVAVLGGTTVAGALAAVSAVARGADEVVALVSTLQDARLVAALGGVTSVITDVHAAGEAANELATALGGPADLVVVASDDRDAVTTAVLLAGDGTVVLSEHPGHAAHAAAVARSIGTVPVIRVDRAVVRDAGASTTAVVGSSRPLAELVRWRAGVGPAPAATRPEDV